MTRDTASCIRPASAASRWRARGVLLWLALATLACPLAQDLPESATELLHQGKFVFEQNCQVCHGRRGNGRGELAPTTFPRPRDFTRGIFKYHSTPNGSLPTEADLRRTIREGLAGTAMPAFTQLPSHDLDAVIAHLQTLSPRWTNALLRAAPLPHAPVPSWFANPADSSPHQEIGRTLFTAACAPCHGADGRGHGTSAEGLLDDWDHPCPPRDLTRPQFRRGTSPKDLHRTLTAGIGGTPMPSFAETLTELQRWQVVAFLGTWLEPRTAHRTGEPSTHP